MEVQLSHIVKRFGTVTANDDVSLTLAAGRIYGLLGENGAGKSTLMRVLCGLTPPDAGSLTVDGRVLARLTPRLAATNGIGLLPQDPLDFPPLRVWENFALGGDRVLGRREARARLAAGCRRLGIALPPDVPVATLTVAERQYLELARLADRGVRLLVLDEPTTGISPVQKEALFAALRAFVADGDRLVILVTHKLAEARELCDAVAVLRRGRLVGTFATPLDAPAILAAMFENAPDAPADVPPSPAGRPRPEAAPLLRLDDVTFADATTRLARLSLTVRPGEIVGLAGIAGGGQETLLRGLAGLIPAVSGRLAVAGRNLAGRSPGRFLRAGVRYLPAARLEQGLFPGLTLTDHVRLAFPTYRRTAHSLFHKRCVEQFHLADQPDAPAAALSGGNQQRLLLSLVPDDVALLLADNPTRGLDIASVAHIWGHLRRRAAAGTTVLFASEDLDEIMRRAERILVFFDRRLVADLPGLSPTPENARYLGDLMTGRAIEGDAA